MAQKNGCGTVLILFAAITGFGFFSLLWDLAADAWGLGHTTVLLIFAGIVIVVGAVANWVQEWLWDEVTGWWYDWRRERRARKR